MSEKKNIERLFQEKFKDFEVVPSQKVWENIEAELHKKKKRKVIPIWFRLSGVAALLLVGALIGYAIWNESPENNNINEVVNQDQNSQKNDNRALVPIENQSTNNDAVTDAGNSENVNSGDSNSETNTNKDLSQETLEKGSITSVKSKNSGIKNTAAIAHTPKTGSNRAKNMKSEDIAIVGIKKNSVENETKNTQNQNKLDSKNNALASQNDLNSNKNSKSGAFENRNTQNNNVISENKIAFEKELNKTQIAFDKALEEQKKDSAAVATVVPNPLEELLLQQEKEKQAVTETKVNRWQITSNVAPIYFSSASNGSPISQEFSDNSKDYEKNMSYGVGVNYAFSDKWSVRGGVNKLTLGYNTNDIVYYAGLTDASARSENAHFQGRGSQIIIEDNTAANVLSFSDIPGKNAGYLNQTMGYIEVPVELSYKILNRKFGIEIIGGMSTMFLNENSLSVVSGDFVTSAGKAENLNDISFTSNIGLGFKYNFWKSFQANIEPKFKYQINTFSENDGGFKPYFIGIYSGLSFSF
jgi:hypothetical protein